MNMLNVANGLGCMDTLTISQQQNLCVLEEEKEKQSQAKVYTREDYSVVNRFESMYELCVCLKLL